MAEIKAVTFDVGGTLARGGLNEELYLSKVTSYLRQQGFDVSLEGCSRATAKGLEELGLRRKDNLEMSFGEFCSRVLRDLGVTPTEELLRQILSLYFDCFKQVERKGVRRVLAELSESYDLGVISNSMSLAPRRFLEQHGLEKYFKVIVVSGEVGYRKPHPEIFKLALEKLGASPGEVVHVGNSPEEDVKGAKGAGMLSVLITPEAIEEPDAEPDLAVPSIREVPTAIEDIRRFQEFKEVLGERCALCSARGVCYYKVEPEGGEEIDNYLPLCPGCRRETLRERLPRPRKHGKYRAVYRRAWLELHRPKKV
jgi:putative hydrolase of the HAD superfamily